MHLISCLNSNSFIWWFLLRSKKSMKPLMWRQLCSFCTFAPTKYSRRTCRACRFAKLQTEDGACACLNHLYRTVRSLQSDYCLKAGSDLVWHKPVFKHPSLRNQVWFIESKFANSIDRFLIYLNDFTKNYHGVSKMIIDYNNIYIYILYNI